MQILQNDIIKLRALEPEDLVLYDLNTAVFVVITISSTQTPFSMHVLKQYLANAHLDIYEAKQLRLLIVKKDTEEVIGMIDLFDYNPQNKRAGIGILILKKYQNKGYATQAIQIFINYVFTYLDLHQIYANIPVDNLESINLFTKLNFKQTGLKKQWIKKNKTFKDAAFFQIINQNKNEY